MSGPLPDRLAFLTARPFAHRGLHGPGVSENGMAAFDAAMAAGFGIECDVRASADGEVFVFHDADLARMTGADRLVATTSADKLDAMRLPDDGTIPRLIALIKQCAGSVPLLIEIKSDRPPTAPIAPLCAAVARAVPSGAPIAVMSFDPMAMRWFARHAPGTVRGLVVTQQGKGRWRSRIERGLALWLAKPDFLACDIRDLPSPFVARARRKGLPVLTWTVRSPAQRATAATHADQIIFEHRHG